MSFWGYGNIIPNSNVNGQFANVPNTNYSGSFGSNEIPGTNGLPGLSGAKNNIDAAKGYVPGICLKGGYKQIKRKIKNITKKYKKMNKKTLKKRSLRLKKMIHKSLSKVKKTCTKCKHKHTGSCKYTKSRNIKKSRKQRGGYSQYQNNLPLTPSYSVGGILTPSESGLASPPPIKIIDNTMDNYNHYTGKGFPSRGH